MVPSDYGMQTITRSRQDASTLKLLLEEFIHFVPSLPTKLFYQDGQMERLELTDVTTNNFCGKLITHTKMESLQSLWAITTSSSCQEVTKVRLESGRLDQGNWLLTLKSIPAKLRKFKSSRMTSIFFQVQETNLSSAGTSRIKREFQIKLLEWEVSTASLYHQLIPICSWALVKNAKLLTGILENLRHKVL